MINFLSAMRNGKKSCQVSSKGNFESVSPPPPFFFPYIAIVVRVSYLFKKLGVHNVSFFSFFFLCKTVTFIVPVNVLFLLFCNCR